jgi:NAD(P)-dependent dehydrogenase (short-subunit alcohol dehydrogenase family)
MALEAAKKEVEELGGTALVLPLDVSDDEAVERAAEQIEQEFGPIDIWVNNAMVSVFSPVSQMQPEEYKRVTEVTYLGVVYGTLAALKRMRPRNKGVIVQVSSALAFRAIPLQSAYCAAKHAIKGFSEALRCELLHDKSDVKVSMVHMPALNTPQFGWVKSRLPNKPQPVPPIFQPEVAADAIVWAAKHAPKDLPVGVPTLEAIYGEKVAPNLLDHYLANTCYDGQQTHEPDDHERVNNLWAPVPGDHGAHGTFDARSRSFSLELWARTHQGRFTMFGALFCLLFAVTKLLSGLITLNTRQGRERPTAQVELKRRRKRRLSKGKAANF